MGGFCEDKIAIESLLAIIRMLFNKLNYFRVTHQVLCLSDNYNGNALNNIDCICGKKVSSPKPKNLGWLILLHTVHYCAILFSCFKKAINHFITIEMRQKVVIRLIKIVTMFFTQVIFNKGKLIVTLL